MPEQTPQSKYMNFAEFARMFMDAALESKNRMYTELFANLTYPQYQTKIDFIDEIYKVTIVGTGGILKSNLSDAEKVRDALQAMPKATSQCFQQLINALNDKSESAKKFLEMATVVSSIGVPEPERLDKLLNAIQQGAITDSELKYAYLTKIVEMSRNVLTGKLYKGLMPERFRDTQAYRSIIHRAAREIAYHPMATVMDKVDYCSMDSAPLNEKIALLQSAAKKLEEEIEYEENQPEKNMAKIKEILEHKATWLIHTAGDIRALTKSNTPEYKKMEALVQQYKREFNFDSISQVPEGSYIRQFKEKMQQERDDTIADFQGALALLRAPKGSIFLNQDKTQGM